MTSDPPTRVSLLYCPKCRKRVERRPGDLLHYVKTGWPKCCGEVMSLYLPTDKPPRRTPDPTRGVQ